tara:strand:+ start:1125 stop:1430 length:306 start_codon:yes stop_codon:yes gene_type:complete
MINNFNRRCYEKISLIPKGMVSTYAEVAKSLNSNAYRAVGNAMARNPHLIVIPCHRIVKSDGSLGGYVLGTSKKSSLLKKEGVYIKNNQVVGFRNKLYKFK